MTHRNRSFAPVTTVATMTAITLWLLLATALTSSMANARQNVTGIWYDDTGKGAVELFQCGSKICGRIVWLRQPLSKSGKPLRDAYNPSPVRRNRPICGLQVISRVGALSDGTWDGGHIYDPKVGKSYNVAIARLNSNRLRVTGYIGTKLFGKSFIWNRAPASLKRCRSTK